MRDKTATGMKWMDIRPDTYPYAKRILKKQIRKRVRQSAKKQCQNW